MIPLFICKNFFIILFFKYNNRFKITVFAFWTSMLPFLFAKFCIELAKLTIVSMTSWVEYLIFGIAFIATHPKWPPAILIYFLFVPINNQLSITSWTFKPKH